MERRVAGCAALLNERADLQPDRERHRRALVLVTPLDDRQAVAVVVVVVVVIFNGAAVALIVVVVVAAALVVAALFVVVVVVVVVVVGVGGVDVGVHYVDVYEPQNQWH